MKVTNQRIALTKRLLQEGLLRLLKTKPLDKISITELCEEAGINRATFYRHYELPKDILAEMQSDFSEEMLNTFSRPMTPKDVEYFFDSLYQNADLVKLFMKYISNEDMIRLFRYNFQSILEKQMPKYEDAESNRLLYTFLAGGSYFLVRQWLIEDMTKTSKEIAGIVLSVINQDANIFQ